MLAQARSHAAQWPVLHNPSKTGKTCTSRQTGGEAAPGRQRPDQAACEQSIDQAPEKLLSAWIGQTIAGQDVFFVLLYQCVNQPIEQGEDIRIAQGGNAWFGDQYNVNGRQLVVPVPKDFTTQTLEAIALNCDPCIFFRNNQPESCVSEIGCAAQDSQMARAGLYCSFIENAAEFG